MTDDPEIANLEIARDIGLEWFKIHADQRLKVFNFFLLIAGFCIGGFFTSLQIKSSLAASTVAFLLAVACVCFKLLDKRTAQLVKRGETLISFSLSRMATGVSGGVPNIIDLSNERDGVPSYRQVFNVLFCLFALMAIIGMVFPWFFAKSCF